jgi:hypothetical protein
MVDAKRIDGVGAPADALGEFRRDATRITASIRDTAHSGDGLVVAVLDSKASMVSPALKLSACAIRDCRSPHGRRCKGRLSC